MADKWAKEGKIVIIAVLNGTFQRQSFQYAANLMAIADDITLRCAICMKCHKKEAPFSKRICKSTSSCLYAKGTKAQRHFS